MPLAKPRVTEVFFQANLLEGYGYLDTRGGLVRQFAPEFQNWIELDENGSTLHFSDPVDPKSPVAELKVGHQLIWIHFGEEASDVAVREESSRIVDRACAIISVSRLSRQGLRCYYLFQTNSRDDAVDLMRRRLLPQASDWERLGQVSPAVLSAVLEKGRLKALVQIQPIQRVRERVTITGQNLVASPTTSDADEPVYGVLLDVDVYDDRPSDSRDPKTHVNRALKYLSEDVVPFVASQLEE